MSSVTETATLHNIRRKPKRSRYFNEIPEELEYNDETDSESDASDSSVASHFEMQLRSHNRGLLTTHEIHSSDDDLEVVPEPVETIYVSSDDEFAECKSVRNPLKLTKSFTYMFDVYWLKFSNRLTRRS